MQNKQFIFSKFLQELEVYPILLNYKMNYADAYLIIKEENACQ